MFSPWRRLATRLGRWPRRIAALVCLLLAAVTALAPKPAPTTPAGRQGLGLRVGEVAVPVPVQLNALSRYVHGGDRVGVLYSPTDGAPGQPLLVADQLRVLSVDTASDYGTDAVTTVLLAADRTVAVRLARYPTGGLRLVVDRSP